MLRGKHNKKFIRVDTNIVQKDDQYWDYFQYYWNVFTCMYYTCLNYTVI